MLGVGFNASIEIGPQKYGNTIDAGDYKNDIFSK
jgi:hypothetical protein